MSYEIKLERSSVAHRMRKRSGIAVILTAWSTLLAGCEAWFPLPPATDEYNRGLVLLYPGSFNTTSEMIGFYYGLKEGGVDQAIEVVKWAAFLDHMIDPEGAQVRIAARAHEEAARIKAYAEAHPGRPITLVGYSGGAWFAVATAERLDPSVSVDRILMMSPAIRRDYDLTAALAKTRLGAVCFWSPLDTFTVTIAATFNLADSTKSEPAATFSFDMDDTRLHEIEYDPAWREYGYYGEHEEYLLLVGWIAEFVAPWVATPE